LLSEIECHLAVYSSSNNNNGAFLAGGLAQVFYSWH